MFGIGGFELFLILIFAFLIFGPDKLPAIAKTVGRAIGKFREAQEEVASTLKMDELLGADGGARRSTAATPKAGKAAAPSATAPSGPSAPQSTQPVAAADGQERPLSFSERRAAYDRERAARAAGNGGEAAPSEAAAGSGSQASSASDEGEGASR